MARKLCIDCGTRRAQSHTPEGRMCDPCYDYAGAENEHGDMGHDDIDTYSVENTTFNTQAEVDAYIANVKIDMKSCPVCHPELDPRSDKPRTGHTNTVAHSHTSHADHNHPRTPAARAMCRKSMKETGNPVRRSATSGQNAQGRGIGFRSPQNPQAHDQD
jgi:hypothetical protein